MKRSYLLSGVTTLVVLGGLGIFLLTQRGLGTRPAGSVATQVPAGQQAVYKVNFQVNQKPHNGDALTAYSLNGKFVVYRDASGDLVSEWGDLPEFSVVGVPASAQVITSMIGKPMVSRMTSDGEIEHFIGKDFPGRYLGMQIGILDKAFIVPSQYQIEPITRRERDEFGQFQVQYSYQKSDDESYVVTRRWQQSLDGKSLFDATANSFTYSYSKSGELKKVDGRTILNYKTSNGGVDTYTTQFSMEIDDHEPTVAQKVQRSTRDLPRADLGRAEIAAKTALIDDAGEDALPTIENIAQALQRSDNFRADSPGSEQQEIFQTLKFGIMANPSEASKVIDKILAIKDVDDDSEAKSSLLFGALTATGLPEVADAFSELAQSQCPNDLCRIQAITSLNIHDHPSESNGKVMLALAHSSENEDVVSAAYLAAGSIASKANGDATEIAKTLLSDFQSAKDDRRVSVLQAMGNHGAAEYYSVLESQAKSEDTFERSSALYSLRNIPVDGATTTLIASLNVDGSDIVNVNSLRALAQKSLSATEQIKVAEAFTTATDKDVQAAVTDLLLNNYRANVEGSVEALAAFKEKSEDADLKSYLDEAVEDIKKDREKDYLYK